jgi:hypothetical protein
MFNEPKVELKLQLNADIKNGSFIIKEQVLNTEVKVFVSYDNVSCYVGQVSDVIELLELVGPENILNTLWELANDYEYDTLVSALDKYNRRYWIGDRLYTAVLE